MSCTIIVIRMKILRIFHRLWGKASTPDFRVPTARFFRQNFSLRDRLIITPAFCQQTYNIIFCKKEGILTKRQTYKSRLCSALFQYSDKLTPPLMFVVMALYSKYSITEPSASLPSMLSFQDLTLQSRDLRREKSSKI